MTHAIETREGFAVHGLRVRASNADPSPIGAVWGRVMGESLAERVPARLDDVLVAIYCAYEGDHTDPYTFVLGWRVPADADAPEGLVKVQVEAGPYASFVAEGEPPSSIMKAWGAIWEAPIERAFVTDYELHDPANPTRTMIHVGVRAP